MNEKLTNSKLVALELEGLSAPPVPVETQTTGLTPRGSIL